jgi:uncharacterized protein
MNLAAMLKAFDAPTDLPEEALRWGLDHWDIARPALVQVLARCARNPEGARDGDMLAAYFGLFLLAQKRDPAAAPMLRALIKAPEGAATLFADDGSMSLGRVMISVFDGDARAQRALAEDLAIDPFMREMAYETVAWLTAAGKIDRDETIAWLAAAPARFESIDPIDADWISWGFAVARLGVGDLIGKAREAFGVMGEQADEAIEELDVIFAMAREESDPLAVFARDGIGPVEDAIADLRRIDEIAATLEEMEGEDEGEEALAPVVNEFRDVGRNDPCPCGSGKKFKKCCLAA